MKKFIIIILLSLIRISVSGQDKGFTYQSSVINVPRTAIIDMSEPVPEFNPNLLLLKSAMPSPTTDIKQKKILLDERRSVEMQTSKIQSGPIYQKTAAALPTMSVNFRANVTQGTPNDNDLAVSNGGKIISVANSNLFFFDDNGTGQGSKALSTFAAKLGSLNRTYDPRVIYDPKKDRFIVVFLQGSTSADTRIIVAFSQTNDPAQKWNFYVVPGNITQDSSTWSDYPIVALTDNDLFVTVNRVKDNTPWQQGFVESYIWQIDKQKGYDSSSVLSPKVYHDIKYNGKTIWNICPAKGGSGTFGPNMFLVSLRPSDLNNDTVFLHEITNSLASGNAQLTLKIIKTDKAYGLMPNALQPGGKRLQTNDARVLSACFEENWIHYVANTIDTSTFSPAVYYGRITNLNLATPAIHGTIISSDTMDFGYPSVTYIGGGVDDRSVMITYSYSSKTHFPGTAATYVDRAGNLSGTFVVKKGETNIQLLSDSIERWGDYTGIQRKYNEPGFCWLNGSYGFQNGLSTWIAKLKNNDLTLNTSETRAVKTESTLYPNPVSDYINLDFELRENKVITFEICDINGRLVSELLRDKGKAGLNRFSFRTNDLKEGIYFLMIKYENEVIEHKKFVVTR